MSKPSRIVPGSGPMPDAQLSLPISRPIVFEVTVDGAVWLMVHSAEDAQEECRRLREQRPGSRVTFKRKAL